MFSQHIKRFKMGFKLRWYFFIAVSHYFPFVMCIVCKHGLNFCDIENWASWEPCNSTCGQGLRKRQKIICCQYDLLTKCLESCGITTSWCDNNSTEFMSCGTCMNQGIFDHSKNKCICSSEFRDYVISKTSLTTLTKASSLRTLPTLKSHKCVRSRWTPWINQDKPWVNKDNPNIDIGESDHELLTPEELERFCPRGNITKVECMVDSEHPIPYYSTGDVVNCDKQRGLVCNNGDNFPVPCNDYKIRYYCECPVETTKPTFSIKPTFKTTTNKPTTTKYQKTFPVTIQPIDSTRHKHLVGPTSVAAAHQGPTKPIKTWAIILIATACFLSIVICCCFWCLIGCCCNKGGKKKIKPDLDNT